MDIIFRERQISEATLSVLKHLYYYTVQYGLSVKQFTGEHQDYWKELPARLRNLQDKSKKVEAIIKELEKLASGHEKRRQKRREQFKRWSEKEIVINAQLVSILSAMPSALLSTIFKHLISTKIIPQEYKVVDLKIKGEKGEAKDFVEPDLLLLNEKKKQLLMIELKTRGNSTASRNYPVQQLLNYIRLALECENSNNSILPKEFLHLILVPSVDRKWLEDNSKWVLKKRGKDGNRIYVDPDVCIKLGNKYTKKHSKDIPRLLKQIPIYYYSWKELSKAFDFALIKFNDKRNSLHWKRIGNELRELAEKAGLFA